MTDDRGASASTPAAERPGTPAEAQFPYAATHGLQPSTPTPSLRRQRPTGRRSPLPLVRAGAVLFGLAVIAAYVVWGSPPDPRSPAAAAQVVRGYLNALTRGDAASAMAYSEQQASDPSLLTPRMLAEQRPNARLSQVTVHQPSEPGKVPASYRLGTEPVSAVYQLTLHDHGWVLDRAAAEIDLSGFAIPVAVNGMAPESLRPSLFPGHYLVTSQLPRYRVTDGDLIVAHPFASPEIDTGIDLSEAGRAEVIAAAESRLTDCLSRHDLDPSGCGFSVVDPQQTDLDASSVTWSAKGAADLSTAEFSLDHAGSASADIDLTIHGEFRGVDGSRWKAEVQVTRLRADLTGPVVKVEFG